MVFPKFIIEENELILGMVQYHKELITVKENVKGGGWFRINHEAKTITFHGDSHDLGRASLENIQRCVTENEIYDGIINISDDYTFFYDTQTEIINLSNPTENG